MYLIPGIIIGVILALCLFSVRSSKHYRKILKDLFVAGRIRQIAADKGINLSEEYESYKAFKKRRNIRNTSLDDSIEEDLQEEIIGDDIDLFDNFDSDPVDTLDDKSTKK